jgi:hypothetical protein
MLTLSIYLIGLIVFGVRGEVKLLSVADRHSMGERSFMNPTVDTKVLYTLWPLTMPFVFLFWLTSSIAKNIAARKNNKTSEKEDVDTRGSYRNVNGR